MASRCEEREEEIKRRPGFSNTQLSTQTAVCVLMSPSAVSADAISVTASNPAASPASFSRRIAVNAFSPGPR